MFRVDRQYLSTPKPKPWHAALHPATEDRGELLAAQHGTPLLGEQKEAYSPGGPEASFRGWVLDEADVFSPGKSC